MFNVPFAPIACRALGVAVLWSATATLGVGGIGPDVVDHYVANSIHYLGTVDGIGGYAFGTTSCNWGDMEADWYGGTNDTPLIGQNAYRLKNGRFEQIGTSWLKHSFCALSEGGCGDCQSTDCSTLGIGCADTYGAGLNTNPGGPRSDVNAFTGQYPYPFNVSPSGPSALRGNLCIANADVDPDLNPGARYFFEGFYVCTDEAPWSTQFNNASWREITFGSASSPNAIGQTHVAEMAIRVWADIDPTVTLTDVMVPGDGLIVVGSKVTDLGTGFWRYEYAIYNYNSDRAVGGISIALPANVEPTNLGFHDVDAHSGEIWDGADWGSIHTVGDLTWSTNSYAENPNANAIRWDSLYNVRFDLPVAPVSGSMTLNLFKPGGVGSIAVAGPVPGGDPVDPCKLPLPYCPADVDGSNRVDVGDMLEVISQYGTCGDGTFRPTADIDGDCCVGVNDVLEVIGLWDVDCAQPGACCLDSGACNSLSETDCNEAGGIFHGEGSLCEFTACPLPGACCLTETDCGFMLPAACDAAGGSFRGAGTACESVDCMQAEYNDDCDDAWLIGVGNHEFSTYEATTDGDQHGACKFDGQCYNDIWFRFTPQSSGTLTVSTCNLVNYDSDLVLYQGWNCDDLQLLDCNDDAAGCSGYSSQLSFPVTDGQQLMIRVGGWDSGDAGSGELSVQLD